MAERGGGSQRIIWIAAQVLGSMLLHSIQFRPRRRAIRANYVQLWRWGGEGKGSREECQWKQWREHFDQESFSWITGQALTCHFNRGDGEIWCLLLSLPLKSCIVSGRMLWGFACKPELFHQENSRHGRTLDPRRPDGQSFPHFLSVTFSSRCLDDQFRSKWKEMEPTITPRPRALYSVNSCPIRGAKKACRSWFIQLNSVANPREGFFPLRFSSQRHC